MACCIIIKAASSGLLFGQCMHLLRRAFSQRPAPSGASQRETQQAFRADRSLARSLREIITQPLLAEEHASQNHPKGIRERMLLYTVKARDTWKSND